MTDRALVEHITGLPHSRANFKQLVRELGYKGEARVELESALARLAARGDLIQLHNGQYVVASMSREFAVGRLNLHRDGYGFLISERPIPKIAGDIFIPPDSAQKAMHGDRVIVRIARIESGGRADGEIVKILKRANTTVVGEFKIGRKGAVVVPHDARLQDWITIPEGMEIPAPARNVDRKRKSECAAPIRRPTLALHAGLQQRKMSWRSGTCVRLHSGRSTSSELHALRERPRAEKKPCRWKSHQIPRADSAAGSRRRSASGCAMKD